MTAYSAGLRVKELVNLTVHKIDPELMMIHIERRKDGKGRYTLLSHRLLAELRAYWQRYEPRTWVFPNRAKDGPLSRTTAQHIYTQARRRAGIEKGRGIHIRGEDTERRTTSTTSSTRRQPLMSGTFA